MGQHYERYRLHSISGTEAPRTDEVGAHSLQEMVAKLKKPRRVMILVKAGAAVDAFIEKLVPLLSQGDIIIDGGNSEYQDTVRRVKDLESRGILFVGSGVSGGEEGARYGPSLMPGGNPAAWPAIKPIFQAGLNILHSLTSISDVSENLGTSLNSPAHLWSFQVHSATRYVGGRILQSAEQTRPQLRRDIG